MRVETCGRQALTGNGWTTWEVKIELARCVVLRLSTACKPHHLPFADHPFILPAPSS